MRGTTFLRATSSWALIALAMACGSPSVDPPIPGLYVTAKTTHVVLGTIETDGVVAQFRRTEGSLGSYLVFEGTGGSKGTVDAGPLADESYPGEVSAHESLVLAYYRQLGLPEDQVDVVTSNVLFGSSPSTPKQVQTLIGRKVDGFVVADSLLVAICLDALRCLDESVAWPSIPYDIVRSAHAFDQAVTDSYRARLPVQNGGAVTIHHTGWKTAPLVFSVTFDLLVGGTVKHFDRDAREVTLPT